MSNKKKLKFKEVINSKKPVLVDFYATWCGPCKALSPIVNQVKKELGSDMRVIKIDVDQKKSISNKYKITSLPTLAIFQNGKILWRESGMKTKAELLKITSHFIENNSPKTSVAPKASATSGTRKVSGASEEIKAPKKETSWFGRLFKRNK